MNWPIGSDRDFKGVYNRQKKRIELFGDSKHGSAIANTVTGDLNDPKLSELLGPHLHQKLLDDVELLDHAGDDFDLDKILSGELTPVFFGSALTNFGIEPFLESFLNITTPPQPRLSNLGPIDPQREAFSGFIFKIQANMNPTHRDPYRAPAHLLRQIRTGHGGEPCAGQQEGQAGPTPAVHGPGPGNGGNRLPRRYHRHSRSWNLQYRRHPCSDDSKIQYEGIPVFAPEHFAKIYTKNSLKRKQFLKGITQLSEEGSIQVFKRPNIGIEELIIGVVGVLQFEVLEYRLKN